jgi:hypothetical protein
LFFILRVLMDVRWLFQTETVKGKSGLENVNPVPIYHHVQPPQLPVLSLIM